MKSELRILFQNTFLYIDSFTAILCLHEIARKMSQSSSNFAVVLKVSKYRGILTLEHTPS